MPYRRVGKTIQHKRAGKWTKKQTTKSIPAAKRAMNLLRGVEHGWKPTRRKTASRPRKRR